MKLEEEIQQAKFRNEHQKAMINIAFTHFWLFDKMRKFLKPHGISLQQFNVLRILRGQHPNPSSVSLLKDRMLDKSSDASRLVERLRVKGYVDRATCPSDRRAVEICITQKGLDVLQRVDNDQNDIDNILHNLSEKEAKQLNDLLDKLRSE